MSATIRIPALFSCRNREAKMSLPKNNRKNDTTVGTSASFRAEANTPLSSTDAYFALSRFVAEGSPVATGVIKTEYTLIAS